MAIEQVRKSDASGKEIPEGTGARVRVLWNTPGKADLRADLTDEEVMELMPWLQPVTPRPTRRKA